MNMLFDLISELIVTEFLDFINIFSLHVLSSYFSKANKLIIKANKILEIKTIYRYNQCRERE